MKRRFERELDKQVYRNSSRGVENLVKRGADLDAIDSTGLSALHRAAIWGNLNSLESLLAAGADTNIRNVNGATPLHTAAHWQNVEVMTALIRFGSDLLASDKNGVTPMKIIMDVGLKNDLLDALLESPKSANCTAAMMVIVKEKCEPQASKVNPLRR